MKSKIFSIFISSATALFILLSSDYLGCFIPPCGFELDDASIRAEAMKAPMVVVYLVFYWLFILPGIVVSRKRFGLFGSSFTVSLVFALVLAGIFHNPEIDGTLLHTALYLGSYLFLPWFIGGIVALVFWPDHHSKHDVL